MLATIIHYATCTIAYITVGLLVERYQRLLALQLLWEIMTLRGLTDRVDAKMHEHLEKTTERTRSSEWSTRYLFPNSWRLVSFLTKSVKFILWPRVFLLLTIEFLCASPQKSESLQGQINESRT